MEEKRKLSKKSIIFISCIVVILAAVGVAYVLLNREEVHQDVAISRENFPDENLRARLTLEYDLDESGVLEVEELEEVMILWEDENIIESLEGIELLYNLQSLIIPDNLLKELDISKNKKMRYVICYGNQLEELDVTKNKNLEYLACSGNMLKELDLSKNPKLNTLDCSNNQLTTLDVKKNKLLEEVTCDENQLITLDFSKNKKLSSLSCANNKITEIKLSAERELRSFVCFGNEIENYNLEKKGNNYIISNKESAENK